jgi:hypothetical protein
VAWRSQIATCPAAICNSPGRRTRLAGDLLHERDGTLPDERDRHRLGADAVARDAASSSVGRLLCGSVLERRELLVRFALSAV